ncbi:hypothetical protein [Lutibaculum baratangense]|uniref:Uncharacterized protein n=1 Tax=Lutibaculum baratangense AMV1 TaxID=631454 RepID=V4R5D4_9HYPH|nr:hypothetical protein [Lutibaculum baratangense]ESR27162.1 hypothetical protein N177_0141 [Lutibaculum baratangense AMV1]
MVRVNHLTREELAWLKALHARKPIFDLPMRVDVRLKTLGLTQPVCGWPHVTPAGERLLGEERLAA